MPKRLCSHMHIFCIFSFSPQQKDTSARFANSAISKHFWQVESALLPSLQTILHNRLTAKSYLFIFRMCMDDLECHPIKTKLMHTNTSFLETVKTWKWLACWRLLLPGKSDMNRRKHLINVQAKRVESSPYERKENSFRVNENWRE